MSKRGKGVVVSARVREAGPNNAALDCLLHPVAFLRIGGSDDSPVLRPFLVVVVDLGAESSPASGILFTAGDADRDYLYCMRTLATSPTNRDSMKFLTGVRRGSGVGEYRRVRG